MRHRRSVTIGLLFVTVSFQCHSTSAFHQPRFPAISSARSTSSKESTALDFWFRWEDSEVQEEEDVDTVTTETDSVGFWKQALIKTPDSEEAKSEAEQQDSPSLGLFDILSSFGDQVTVTFYSLEDDQYTTLCLPGATNSFVEDVVSFCRGNESFDLMGCGGESCRNILFLAPSTNFLAKDGESLVRIPVIAAPPEAILISGQSTHVAPAITL